MYSHLHMYVQPTPSLPHHTHVFTSIRMSSYPHTLTSCLHSHTDPHTQSNTLPHNTWFSHWAHRQHKETDPFIHTHCPILKVDCETYNECSSTLTSASRLCTARNTDATTSTRMIHFSFGHKPLRQHVTQRLVTTEHHGHDSNRCVNTRNRMHTQTNPFPTRSLEPDWESQTDEVLFETCCLQGHLSWFISHNKN